VTYDPDAGLDPLELRQRLRQFRAMLWRARSGNRAELERMLAVEALAGNRGEMSTHGIQAPPIPPGSTIQVELPSYGEMVATRVTVQYPHHAVLASVIVGNQCVIAANKGVRVALLANDMPLMYVRPGVLFQVQLCNEGPAAHDVGVVTLWGVM
jgi:hypothetical protein